MNKLSPLEELEQILKTLTSTPVGRRMFLASVPFLLTACATGRHRNREGDNSGQNTEMSVQDEQRMTQEVLPQMRKDYPPIENAELQAYISDLGQRIVAANGLRANPYNYNFTVVGVNYVNAFALPAGTVMVTAPLLEMAETEAELAGVVGHEIGHIKARHTAERMDRAKKDQKKSWLFAVGGGLLGGAAGFGAGKLLCPPKDTNCLVKASAIGAAAGAGGGFLIQKYAFMANSQEDEMEADRIGFRTSVNAGFSKDHVGTFYAKLLKMEEAHKKNNVPVLSSIVDAMSTHPPSKERVAQMQQMAGEARQPSNAKVSSKSFEKAKTLAKQWIQANPARKS
ncbi:MAG: M48 family metalloprotease [Bdellovibrionota bacterium]